MDIPSGWKSFHLKDVTYESRVRAASENSTNLVVFGVSNQTGLSTASKYHADNLDRYKVVKPGMFAYNPMRLNIGSIGYCKDDLGEGLVSPDYVVFGCKENKLDSKYLSYCIREHHWKDWVRRAGSGSVRVRIYYKDISIYPIILPPLAEQHKIADILSTWDEAIAKTEQLITALQHRKKGLMQRLLTGEVRFAGFEDEWKEAKFSEIFNLKIGRTPPRNEPAYWDPTKQTNNVWLSISDLNGKYVGDSKEYISSDGARASNSVLIPKGVVIMSFKLTIGKAAITSREVYTNEAICALTPKKNNIISNQFLYYALSVIRYEKEIDQAVKGQTLNIQKIKRLSILLPRYQEQLKIVKALESADDEIFLHEAYLEKIKQQKKGLMQRLLTGQVRVKV